MAHRARSICVMLLSVRSATAALTSTCSAFLLALNSDATLATCSAASLSAVAAFTSGSSTASASIANALSSLCTSGKACSAPSLAAQLTAFAGNCSLELAAPGIPVVQALYDSLYILAPFSATVCSTSTSSSYCLQSLASSLSSLPRASPSTNSSALVTYGSEASAFSLSSWLGPLSTNASALARPLPSLGLTASSSTRQRRQLASSAVINTPDGSRWSASNVYAMMLAPSMPSSVLCTTCTQIVLSTWAAWMSSVPYANPSGSPTLSTMPALWKGVSASCGADFLAAVPSIAGSSSVRAGAASPSASISQYLLPLSALLVYVVTTL